MADGEKKKITEIKHPKVMEVISIPKVCRKAYLLSSVLKVRGKDQVLQKSQCKFCSWLQLQKKCSIRAVTNGNAQKSRGIGENKERGKTL